MEPFGVPKPMDIESQAAMGRGPAPEVKYNEYGEPVTPKQEFPDYKPEVMPPTAAESGIPTSTPEATAPVTPATPEAAATITITEADIQARIDAAVQAALAERPKREAILERQRLARRKAVENVGKAVKVVGNEISLAMDPDGREYVKEDIKAVTDEALRRANETADAAVKKGAEALKWLGKKGDQLLETAELGVNDSWEYVVANVNEPSVRMLVGQDRFFNSLVARARLRTEDFKIGIQRRVEKAGGFAGRVARVMEGVNDVLEREEFPVVEMMDDAANKLADEARKRADEAARKAIHYRGLKATIAAEEYFDKIAAENDVNKAKKRTETANKFPNFMSKLSKLFGKG